MPATWWWATARFCAQRHCQQHGTIVLNSAGNRTRLELIQYGITLQGGGQLTLSDSDANAVFGTDPSVTFTNVDNTISGAGQFGEGQMTLVNGERSSPMAPRPNSSTLDPNVVDQLRNA